MRKILYLPILLCLVCACNEAEVPKDNKNCIVEPFVRAFSQNQLTQLFPAQVLEGLAASSAAGADGAMGRNKEGYFHVRFQMGISPLANFAVGKQRPDILEMTVKAIEYSFERQTPDGDFDMVIPPGLAQAGVATEGDKVSGVAFFASSLGCGLLALKESSWFQQQAGPKNRITDLTPKLALALAYLKSKKDLLEQVDGHAPNRLLFDALAYFSLGKYLNDAEAMRLGVAIARLALSKQDGSGFFVEGGGWDSSYNAVCTENGFRLLTLLLAQDPFFEELYNSIACSMHWQATRVAANGEVLTEGNTRVYQGGETFLGAEKGMAYKSVLFSLLAMHHHTGNAAYATLADKVIQYYQ